MTIPPRLLAALPRLEPARWQPGVKLAVAGLITFWAANWLRLEEPAWGVATCLVLLMPKYVGAIGEKALLRTLGNLAGAVLGVLLVGNFAEDPPALIAGFFLVTAYCSWRYGGNAHPYAFLLAAVTLNRVVVPNLDHPVTGAWATATNRTLEISLGILVSTTVYSVLWPRYAREEFLAEARAVLGELAEALHGGAAGLANRSVARVTRLRKLLQAGARESVYFRRHYGVYSDLTTRLGGLYVFSLLAAAHRGVGETAGLVERLHHLAGRRLEAIAAHDADATHRLRRAFREDLRALRLTLENRLAPADAASSADQTSAPARADAGVYLTLRHLHSQLRELSELYGFLRDDPGRHRRYPSAGAGRAPAFPTESHWVRIAVKSTTAGVAAWGLCLWLQPPGATYIPYFVWFFLLLSRQFQDNLGDRGVLTFAFHVTWVGLLYVAALLLLAPWLTNFAFMNLLLGAALFAYGAATATFTGWTRWSRLAFFATLSALGLPLQQGVTFEAAMTSYWQVVLALWFAALVGRLWWPILPHWEVCSRMAGFFRAAHRLVGEGDPAHRRTCIRQLGLLVNEASAWSARLDTADFAPDETARWTRALAAARLLAYRLRLLVFLTRRNRAILARAGASAENLAHALQTYLAGWSHAFARRGRVAPPPLAPLAETCAALAQLPAVAALPPAHRVVYEGLLAATDEFLAAARAYEQAMTALSLRDYAQDRAL